MELKRYGDAESFPIGNLTVRDMSPLGFEGVSMAEVEVPIGVENPPFADATNDKVYVGITGEIEFNVEGSRVRLRRGDVLLVKAHEIYSYHNGGYELGRLFLLQRKAD